MLEQFTDFEFTNPHFIYGGSNTGGNDDIAAEEFNQG